ncbi:MAG: heavy-metal-associated domain-containing protein [Marinilabiliaceae bacterium]
MQTLKFKTTMKCNGCVQTVTPFLENSNNIRNWSVDLQNPDRILTVQTAGDAEEVKNLLKEAGYQAEEI